LQYQNNFKIINYNSFTQAKTYVKLKKIVVGSVAQQAALSLFFGP